jgi:hypothetical protein
MPHFSEARMSAITEGSGALLMRACSFIVTVPIVKTTSRTVTRVTPGDAVIFPFVQKMLPLKIELQRDATPARVAIAGYLQLPNAKA